MQYSQHLGRTHWILDVCNGGWGIVSIHLYFAHERKVKIVVVLANGLDPLIIGQIIAPQTDCREMLWFTRYLDTLFVRI